MSLTRNDMAIKINKRGERFENYPFVEKRPIA